MEATVVTIAIDWGVKSSKMEAAAVTIAIDWGVQTNRQTNI